MHVVRQRKRAQGVRSGLLGQSRLRLVLAGTAAIAVVGSGTAYAHLYRMQTDLLHRPAVTEGELHTRAACDKGGTRVEDRGPGNDWRCVVSWRLPGSSAEGSAIYQLDVTAEGRYVADGDGPKEVNGFFSVHTPSGDAPNPLWQFDGYVDLL